MEGVRQETTDTMEWQRQIEATRALHPASLGSVANQEVAVDDGASEQPETKDTAGEEDPDRVRPRVYVASLSDYNAGVLHGRWLPADTTEEELANDIAGMLAASPTAKGSGQPAEEWAVHDSEGFNGLHLDEHEGLGYLTRIGRGVAEHGVAFAHWARLVASDDELDGFGERYRGHWDSLEAYADDLLDDLGAASCLEAIPDWLQPYVELHTGYFARDLKLGGDIATSEGEGGVHVWSSS